MQNAANYVGRYAPSPTGDLHLGNVQTALLAWLHARLHQGTFLLRMEDLDTPRTVPGSDMSILHDLEWLGLDWDGQVVYQSARTAHYQHALDWLSEQGLTYACYCSRKDILSAASAPHRHVGVYPGTCRGLNAEQQAAKARHKSPAIRVRVPVTLADCCGDFVVRRADGLFAYQLAVVVDDLAQEVTNVVRGADLADSTDRQRYLASLLAPQHVALQYHHAPLLKDASGHRMAKRDGSHSLRQVREQGQSPESVIGALVHALGLTSVSAPISAAELLAELTLPQLNVVLA
ncbi:glutamyl-Q tRNA(Asp) synthetase [Arenicella chitinivorans]|uniref:Glutamyl-Q tRNA(Asp) synthetase n=1 Tax=Arenicella chitinivorans TaxID=1329800 RepID=A0A918RVS7_9GAMM|nr:tRNA glutamyl-Q(34) synthetase GluQRS [Arenicella chitinivorans]GHA13048.1 glutamyl-Q tRNA(Asp) synthetase [Arenicella chitinivorans]